MSFTPNKPLSKTATSFVIIAVLILGIGAAVIKKYNYFSDKHVNVLEQAKNNTPGLRWIHPVDSAKWAYPVNIEGEVYFAGEKVPLEDPEVKERLERELLINVNWHS